MARIVSLDVLRGFALLGILLLNIVSFGLPFAAYLNPTVAGGATGANLTVWYLATIFWDGKMRAIFSMLFAASFDAFLAGLPEADRAKLYYRRTLWLIVFGLLHAHLLWSGDILYPYGVIGLLLYFFRQWPARKLIWTGAAILVLHSLWNFGGSSMMRDMQQRGGEEWAQIERLFAPSPQVVEEQIRTHRAGYLASLAMRSRDAYEFEGPLFFQYIFLDVLGMFVLGLGLARAGLFDASRSARFYAVMAVAGFALGLPLNYWAAAQWHAAEFGIPAYFAYIASTQDPGRLLVAAGYIGIVMLLVQANVRWFVQPLANVGRMALSNYLLTSLLMTLFFDGIGLGQFARWERAELYRVVLGMWVINLTWSPLWLRYFRYGPAEWVWRSLTYWRLLPLRRTSA
ncbi:MAG: DUF418 domain-containing protein [Acidobacteria bacterium]|nr:DUF418 domain-containing protein [Bryobacteraceae bacterium CoA2 C42]